MGEEADWIVNNLLDGGCRDDDGWGPPPDPHCRHCGVQCEWGRTSGHWRLYEGNKPHRCKVEFDPVD